MKTGHQWLAEVWRSGTADAAPRAGRSKMAVTAAEPATGSSLSQDCDLADTYRFRGGDGALEGKRARWAGCIKPAGELAGASKSVTTERYSTRPPCRISEVKPARPLAGRLYFAAPGGLGCECLGCHCGQLYEELP